jgi:ribonuclease HII
VVAGAVIFQPGIIIPGINDSKRLTAFKREELAHKIKSQAEYWNIGVAEADEIDDLNILQATSLAMLRAVKGLTINPPFCLIDGLPIKNFPFPHLCLVKGDKKCFSIASASILAKVHRDEMMLELHSKYPQYGFDRHKGYPTLLHRQAIAKYGLSPEHRKSFHCKDSGLRNGDE